MSQTITRARSKSLSPGQVGDTSSPLLHQDSPGGLSLGSSRLKPTPSKIKKSQHSNVEKTYEVLNMHKVAKRSGKWCLINLSLAVLTYFEVLQWLVFLTLSWHHLLLKYLEMGLVGLFGWNVISNLYRYVLPAFSKAQVQLSQQQKALLGISKENEKLFATTPQRTPSSQPTAQSAKKVITPPSLPMRRSPARNVSTTSQSSVLDYSPGRQSLLQAQGSPSCQGNNVSRYTPLNTKSPQQHGSPFLAGNLAGNSPLLSRQGATPSSSNSSPGLRGKQISPSRLSSLHMDDELLDYDKFEQYMKSEEENELRNRRANPESPKGPSFWSYGRAAYEYIPSFGTYQLATRSQSPSMKDDDDTVESPYKNDEMWKKLAMNKRDVDVWTENIRKWLAQTVIEPLVQEINNINTRLTQMGSPELHIGTIGHSSLQNLATTKFQQLPSLPSVLPYLSVTTNQEYLVSRLKELATGGCLRLFRWDSGGAYKGKAWNSDLPADAQIISHLFCAYMDTHLPSNPRYPEGKSFTGLHFLKTPSKPTDKKSELCLYQSRTQKPHFKVLVEDTIWELPSGRNNLFHGIVVFLYFAKRNHHGMLERVNLGASGINVLWVLDK